MTYSTVLKTLLAGVAFSVISVSAFAQDVPGFSISTGTEAPVKVETASAIPGEKLRQIRADKSDLFFSGESSNKEFPFFALPSETTAPATLVLTTQTAVSAAPEGSRMRVFINDNDVGTIDLRSGDPQRVELPVAANVIQPGYNAVSFLVEEKHRVDCSVDATYELWTQIDPEKSGLRLGGTPWADGGTIQDLIAEDRNTVGQGSLVAHILPGASSADIDRTLSVIQALSVMGDFDRPAVTFASGSSTTPGIDIAVGTFSTVRDLFDGPDAIATPADGVTVEKAAGSQRKRLVLSARTAEELDVEIRDFIGQSERRETTGTPQGLRALANIRGKLLTPLKQVDLKQLGFISKPFKGRHYESTISFSMPSDFYPADYASLILNLDAQYAAGLAKNAELIVKANDQIVSNIQLGASRTGMIKDQRLPIPLSKLRPGENTLTFEARLPTTGDAVCDPVAMLNEAPRLMILDSSFLDVPNFARIGRYPDIAALVSGSAMLNPDGKGKPLSVFVPGLDGKLLDVAGSFLAKMAYSSGKIIPVNFTQTQPDDMAPAVLAFGTYQTLPQSLQSEMQLDLTGVPMVNMGVTGDLAATFNAESQQAFNTASPEAGVATDTSVSDGLQARLTGVARQTVDWAGSRLVDTKNWAQMRLEDFGLQVGENKRKSEIYQPPANAAFLIAQHETTQGGVWTVVASPSADGLVSGMTAVSNRALWRHLNGAVQAYSQGGQLVDEKSGGRQSLFQTQPSSVSNLRLVVAGWLSNNAGEYAVFQIVAAMFLGLSTFMLLRNGRKHK